MQRPSIDNKVDEALAPTSESNQATGMPLNEVLNGIGSSPSDSEDEQKDTEMVQINIAATKSFLKSSDAFVRFKEELNDFNIH